jgi:vitamin B12 transporter
VKTREVRRPAKVITLSGRGGRHGQRTFSVVVAISPSAEERFPLKDKHFRRSDPVRPAILGGNTMNRILGGTALAAVLITPAFAQDTPFQLDDIIFSAGLTPQEAARVGVQVEVLTAEDIADSGETQVADLLNRLPGISVTENGGPGSTTVVRVRGLSSGQYLPVYINGIDVTDPAQLQTSFAFGGLNTGNIARIEVLYGSQSAIYGSEAIAGVINITTVQPPEGLGTETAVNLEAGSYNTLFGSVNVGSRFEGGTLTFSASHFDTDGFSAVDEDIPGVVEDDAAFSTQVTFGATYDLTDTVTIGFDLLYTDAENEFDTTFPAPADANRFLTSERLAGRIFAQIDGGMIDHEIAASFASTDRADPLSGFTTDFQGDRTGLSYKGTVEFSEDRVLVFGADYEEEEYLSFGGGGRDTGEIENSAIYGEYAAALTPDLDLSASLRHDEHSRFGGATTGRIALAWRPTDATTLRASYSTGFRAPSLNELFGPFGANPDLQPETSRSTEIGVDHDFGRGVASATLFYTEIDDLIAFSGGYNQVPGTSVTQGFELGLNYDITERITAFGNYAYLDATDRNGNRLARVPRHDTTLGVSAEFGQNWSADFSMQMVSDRIDGGTPIEDYTVADLSIGYGLSDTTEVYLRVDNLFDEEYQTTRNYGTSDRAFYIGLRTRF